MMKDKSYTRSDLACEMRMPREAPIEGCELDERKVGGISVLRLRICSEAAAQELGRDMGTYVTFSGTSMDRLSDEDAQILKHLLAGEIRGMAARLCTKTLGSDFSVFVAGLGNAALTADAIGPKTVGRLTATRHLSAYDAALFRRASCAAISMLAPGVMGQTGIETLELLRGAVCHVKPDLVLVIDALAARSCARLSSTVQVSDRGIVPGSGVGNHRAAVDAASLGVPVISLGVPTVVNSATLVYDALQEAGIREIDENLERVLEGGRQFFVSPRESDVIVDRVSELLADAIASAFLTEAIGN